VADGRVLKAQGACGLAEPWFLTLHVGRPPPASVDGRAATPEEALSRAARLLATSRAPLFYGLSRSSTEGQRAAVALADLLGATVDTTASLCHASSVMALQEVGESTCTLGEIRNRADLIVYWGSDPLATHPRHLERYALPLTEGVPAGRPRRTLVVVDTQANATAGQADLFLPVEPGGDFDALWALRALVRGLPVEAHTPPPAPTGPLTELAARMKGCRCGVIFFGLGLSMTGVGHRNVEALLRLVTDLNAHTRFYARRMRVLGDVSGADSVLAWQTGFPFAVNLARGYPRYNPGEFSAQGLLERQEVDACLLMGSQDAERFSARARAHLQSIPTVVLDPPNARTRIPHVVRFTTAIPGAHLSGTAYRMDEVPIPLRALLPCDYPSDREVLTALAERLTRRPRSAVGEHGSG
jgi:formylmethanofuran dehydrogenase subunit B